MRYCHIINKVFCNVQLFSKYTEMTKSIFILVSNNETFQWVSLAYLFYFSNESNFVWPYAKLKIQCNLGFWGMIMT